MCLILFAHRAHPEFPLVLAANRDEFYGRPTAPAGFWADVPHVLGGRDLTGGGSWLGITRSGRWAAVTNHRDPRPPDPRAPSRGRLVADFLRGDAPPDAYLRDLADTAGEYNGFNLLCGDRDALYWLSNRTDDGPVAVAPGVHGLSNALLDTPWPKVARGSRALSSLVNAADALEPRALLELLLDRTVAADDELPDTGVSSSLERALSAAFIATPEYGTRSSTALLVRRDGRVEFEERSWTPAIDGAATVRHSFRIHD